MSTTTDIEKKNLEAHVEICAERYKNLETKFENLNDRLNAMDDRMDRFEEHLVDIKNAVTGTEEKSSNRANTILLSVFGVILTALLGIIAKGLFH